MIGPGYLILVFILFLIVLSVTIYYGYQLYLLNQPPPNTNNPNSVQCNPNDVLQAWIENTPNRPVCPSFTNNYVIAGDDIQMFEKAFIADPQTGCCYFSNNSSQATYFPNPWICIGTTTETVFTLNQLNEDPYGFNNNQVVFLIPPCEGIEDDCVGLIQYGTSGNNGLYKLFLFEGTPSNLPPVTPVPPNQTNFSQASFQDFVFVVSPDCLSLIQISIGGTVIAEQQNGLIQLIVSPSAVPSFIPDTIKIFQSGRFYPIAGANPMLSENAANSS